MSGIDRRTFFATAAAAVAAAAMPRPDRDVFINGVKVEMIPPFPRWKNYTFRYKAMTDEELDGWLRGELASHEWKPPILHAKAT